MSRFLRLAGVVVLAWLPCFVYACKGSTSKKKSRSEPRTPTLRSPVPGIRVADVGTIRVGQLLDPKRLRTDGPRDDRRWARAVRKDRIRFNRDYAISGAFGNRIKPTHVYLREEIWIRKGRVVNVGQGFSVIKQQCTKQMKAALDGLVAVIRGCMTADAFVVRQTGRAAMVHYLCERGPVAVKVDLRPVVPEFVDERETHAGILTVSEFLSADAGGWLRNRFQRGQSSSARELLDELAPITQHLASCP